MIFLNALSAPFSLSSASCSRAVSIKRLDCFGSSGLCLSRLDTGALLISHAEKVVFVLDRTIEISFIAACRTYKLLRLIAKHHGWRIFAIMQFESKSVPDCRICDLERAFRCLNFCLDLIAILRRQQRIKRLYEREKLGSCFDVFGPLKFEVR